MIITPEQFESAREEVRACNRLYETRTDSDDYSTCDE